MKKYSPILTMFFFVVFVATAQVSSQTSARDFILVNSRVINPNEYDDIKGSPYFYKEWKYGKLVNAKSEIVDSIFVNYNGYTESFEARHEKRYVELETSLYPFVVVYDGAKETFFRRHIHREISGSYARIVHTNDHASVLQNFAVRVHKGDTYSPGSDAVESFVGNKRYYLVLNEEVYNIKLSKKSILPRLGFPSKLKAFIKEKKLDLRTEKDLALLLDYYSSLLKGAK